MNWIIFNMCTRIFKLIPNFQLKIYIWLLNICFDENNSTGNWNLMEMWKIFPSKFEINLRCAKTTNYSLMNTFNKLMQSQLSIPKDFFASFTLYNNLCNGSGEKLMMNLSRHKILHFTSEWLFSLLFMQYSN